MALVLGYGAGMAATLIAAGLLLVRLRDHTAARLNVGSTGLLARVGAAMPVFTALLVIAVGAGLMLNELSRI